MNVTESFVVFEGYPQSLLNFGIVCFTIFIIIGVPANIITIVALLKCPRLKNATSFFLINLCLADACYILFSLPLVIYTFVMKKWVFPDIICYIYPLLGYSNYGVTMFTIIAITANRYIMIVHPWIYNRIFTKMNMLIIILGIWIIPFLLLVPTAAHVWGKFGFNRIVGACTILPKNDISPKKFLFIAAFFLPVATFVVFYARIYWVVRKSDRKSRTNMELKNMKQSASRRSLSERNEEAEKAVEEKKQNRISSDLKLITVIMVIFIVFVISYFPIVYVKIFDKEKSLPTLNILGYIGVYFSNSVNPFIYVVMSKKYRKAYKNLFCTKKNTSFENNAIE